MALRVVPDPSPAGIREVTEPSSEVLPRQLGQGVGLERRRLLVAAPPRLSKGCNRGILGGEGFLQTGIRDPIYG
jgi:hypothetical protein